MTAIDIIKGKKDNWEIVIGIETHAQIKTNSKLFSTSSTTFGSQHNSNISDIDTGMPGTLPMTVNKRCVELAILTGLGLNCNINKTSVFDRKNYFYPDLPKGYQITQFYKPIATNGFVQLEDCKIRINRLHIEEDAGKSIHDIEPDKTCIDLNRAGIGLMEIVTEPDIRSAEQASNYVRELRAILRALGTCDGNMEKGSMRCDINISVRKEGSNMLGDRVEIKNVNSMRNIRNAILFEANRQVEILEQGEKIDTETMLFDPSTNTTKSIRTKENVADYRYFPDPNIPPLVLSDKEVSDIKSSMPELPCEKRARYIRDMSLSEYDASVLTADHAISAFFEEVIAIHPNHKLAANWITAELFKHLKQTGADITESTVSANHFASLMAMIDNGTISGKIAKNVLDIMFDTNDSPETIVEKHDLIQNTDSDVIDKWIYKVLDENQTELNAYINGKDKLFGFFVGQVMKISKGKASPDIVNTRLKDILQKQLIK